MLPLSLTWQHHLVLHLHDLGLEVLQVVRVRLALQSRQNIQKRATTQHRARPLR